MYKTRTKMVINLYYFVHSFIHQVNYHFTSLYKYILVYGSLLSLAVPPTLQQVRETVTAWWNRTDLGIIVWCRRVWERRYLGTLITNVGLGVNHWLKYVCSKEFDLWKVYVWSIKWFVYIIWCYIYMTWGTLHINLIWCEAVLDDVGFENPTFPHRSNCRIYYHIII